MARLLLLRLSISGSEVRIKIILLRYILSMMRRFWIIQARATCFILMVEVQVSFLIRNFVAWTSLKVALLRHREALKIKLV